MAWLVLIFGGICVVGIASYAVFRTSARLSHTESSALYDLSDGVEWVISRLPASVAEHLTEDNVSALLLWQIESLRRRGLATFGSLDAVSSSAQQQTVFLDEDDLVVEVLKRAWDEGLDIDEVDVVVVLDIHTGYLRSIAAIGSELNGEAG